MSEIMNRIVDPRNILTAKEHRRLSAYVRRNFPKGKFDIIVRKANLYAFSADGKSLLTGDANPYQNVAAVIDLKDHATGVVTNLLAFTR